MGSLLVWIVIGLAAGWLASLFLGGKGLVRSIVVGMLGSVVGGYLVALTGVHLPIDIWWLREVLVAAIGAAIVIIVARMIAR
ncbi:MAG: GlsB/YeaQ/YmgE family stress response membrane protein [Alphaproteobacteria bacterium]|nr:GlsB/YeaQ/YmgE family stress response membrane protein [Alphaproteobacteria bacterium]